MTTATAEPDQTAPAQDGCWPEPLWWLAALAVTVALAIPLFLVEVPPVLDYPNHLARIFVLAHPNDPELSQMFRPNWQILPNIGIDIIGTALLKVTSMHVGGRILLALSLFAPVIGVIFYSRVAFGRFTYWSLASGVVAYNGLFFLGFMNFLLSLGLAFAGAACWLAQRRSGAAWRGALTGALWVVPIFLTHLFGVILFAILIGGQEWARLMLARRGGTFSMRQVGGSALLLVIALLPSVLLYLAGPLSDSAAAPGAWLGWRKFWTVFTPVMTTNIDVTLYSGQAMLLALALVWRRVTLAPGMVVAMLALGLLFVAAPTAIKSGSFVDVRMPVMMAFLLFAGMQMNVSGPRAAVIAAVVGGVLAMRTAYIGSTWIEHRQDLADLRAAMAPLPPLSRVLVARRQSGVQFQTDVPSRVLPGMHRLDGHIAALLMLERRAFWPLMFADPSQQPLVIKPPYDRLSQPLSEPVVWSVLNLDMVPPEELAFARYLPDWRSKFDHVLLIDPLPELTIPHGLTPVVTTRFATLYKIDPRKGD